MGDETTNAAEEIKNTDIVFDCPYCEKSLAIDYRGAGLLIACPDCGNKVQVPIPRGMDISDLDSSDEEQEVCIIHMRKLVGDAQKRVLELEKELEDVKKRCGMQAEARAETVERLETISREIENIERAAHRISENMDGIMAVLTKG